MVHSHFFALAIFKVLEIMTIQPTAHGLNHQPRSIVPIRASQALTMSRSTGTLANGTNITSPQGTQGDGKVHIINNTSSDIAVKLVDRDTGKTLRFAYIQANKATFMSGIGPYNCVLKYNSGTDWNQKTSKFSHNSVFYKLREGLSFNARERGKVYRLTLKSLNGNVQPRQIAERDF